MPFKATACIAAVAAAAAALVTPAGAEARDYCTSRIHDNGVAGVLVGGAAGALLGNNLAHGGGRAGGTLLGAAAGAAVGSNIARSTTKVHCRGPHEGGYSAPPPVVYAAPAPVYIAPPPPAYGVVVYDAPPHDHGEHRGWYKRHHHDDDDDDRGHDHDHDH